MVLQNGFGEPKNYRLNRPSNLVVRLTAQVAPKIPPKPITGSKALSGNGHMSFEVNTKKTKAPPNIPTTPHRPKKNLARQPRPLYSGKAKVARAPRVREESDEEAYF